MKRAELIGGEWESVKLFDDASGASATIATARGGILRQFYACGREILYINDERELESKTMRGGCPVLFPICGRLANREYTYGDKTYYMEIHGFAHRSPWKIVSVDSEKAQVELSLSSNEETRKLYPFDFNVVFKYTLDGNKIIVEQKFKNLSSEKMPFSTGLHPYFRVDNDKAYALIADDKIAFNEVIDFDYKAPCDAEVTVETGLGHGVKICAQGGYNVYVFYTTLTEPMACAEPWTASPNALNTKENLFWLEPNEEREFKVSFEVFLNK